MNLILEVLEIVDEKGRLTGKWRLTVRRDGNQPHGLCTHVHHSYDQAWNCIEAWQAAKQFSGDSSYPT